MHQDVSESWRVRKAAELSQGVEEKTQVPSEKHTKVNLCFLYSTLCALFLPKKLVEVSEVTLLPEQEERQLEE